MQPEWRKVGVAFKILTGKPTRKRLLGISRQGGEKIIRIDLKEGGNANFINCNIVSYNF